MNDVAPTSGAGGAVFLRVEGTPASFSLTFLSFIGTFSASVGTKIYVECTSPSFALNRENWEGVVDEGEEYLPRNEMVVYDMSHPFSVQRYEIPEIFGMFTTSPSSLSLTWLAALSISTLLSLI